jgi:ArsR family transcriptional regulator, arsenate/arsenite/antimonite-responsive transcriptional repressor
VIRKAGLLDSERCEKWNYYRVSKSLQPLLRTMAEQFEATPAADPTLARDARRALKRLARRAETCCPGPRVLASAALGR